MSRDVMGRQMFANGGPAMPQPEMGMDQMAMMAQEQGVDPAQLQGALEMAQGQMQQIDNAENYEQVINGIRGDQQPIEARYAELTSVVGQEDSQATPESVLTLLQPVMQMAAVDQGIGGLAAEEMTAPIEGPMAEGIMSTVGMGEPDPVNFSQGGPVIHMAEGGEPNAKLAEELEEFQRQRDLYASVLGTEDREAALADQRRMTQAQMLFDIAQGGLALASPTERSMSFGERLATSFNPVFGNIGARAGELEKFKQGQAAEQRALDLQALGQAQNVIAAQDARDFTARQNYLNRKNAFEQEQLKILADQEKRRKESEQLYMGKFDLTDFSPKNLPNVFQNPNVFVPYALEDAEKTNIKIAQWEPAYLNHLFQEAAPKTVLDANGKQIRVPGRRLTTDEINILAIKNPSLLKDIQGFDEGITRIPTAEEAKKALQRKYYGTSSAETSGETPIEEEYSGYRAQAEKLNLLGPNEPDKLNAARAEELPNPITQQYKTLNIYNNRGNIGVDLAHEKLQEIPAYSPLAFSDGVYVAASGLGSVINAKKVKGDFKNRVAELFGAGVTPAFDLDEYTRNVKFAQEDMLDFSNKMLRMVMEDAPGGRILKDLLDPVKEQIFKIKKSKTDTEVAAALRGMIVENLAPSITNASLMVPEYAGSNPENYTTTQIQDARGHLEIAIPLLNRALVMYEDFARVPEYRLPSFKDNRVGAISGIRQATNSEQEVTTSSGFGGLANRIKKNTVIK